MSQPKSAVGRRRFLAGGAAIGTGALLTACTSNSPKEAEGSTGATNAPAAAAEGPAVTIGFSAPAADHGWIAAVTTNAVARAKLYKDLTLEATEGTNDPAQQISAVKSLIAKKVDALVILPFDGKALTEVAKEAMAAGIPVVNLDRAFSSPLASHTFIGGDNYGMGVSAGNFIAAQMKAKNIGNPVIVEIAGLDNLELTQDRSKGFKEALASHGLKVTARQAAEFTAATGQKVASQVLQANTKIDALWNHDDDQGIGVEAAIKQSGRTDEFIMVGGAGSKHVMDLIKADKSFVKATVLYNPSMSGSAISLGRLLAQKKGLSDLVEQEIPASITTYSATVTKENVDSYLPIGFA
ncbi:substrate-binding domain-containing protein [Kribbella catacumbae]|uniref:substrate-binding domain-containing protein n=1 Tax=Kribbella catacumbae TaxID=460086 RepID=UPI00037D296F|nr:substrate-binding domain-containing protein [Kribbella catacumbae]